MSNSINAFVTSQSADNHVLYSLLFFIHFEEPELGNIDVDTPISDIDEDTLIVAVSLLETILGVDTPDKYLLENKSKSLRNLASLIRELPKLTDETFCKKLKQDILTWKLIVERN
jgi:hypothetical protein